MISLYSASGMHLFLMGLMVLSSGISRPVDAYDRHVELRSTATFLAVATGPECFLRTKYVKRGKWRTLESFWNAKGTAFFKDLFTFILMRRRQMAIINEWWWMMTQH